MSAGEPAARHPALRSGTPRRRGPSDAGSLRWPASMDAMAIAGSRRCCVATAGRSARIAWDGSGVARAKGSAEAEASWSAVAQRRLVHAASSDAHQPCMELRLREREDV